MTGWKAATPAMVLVACLWSAPALADRLEGVLDGEARQWYIIKEDNESNATFTELSDLYSVDLVGVVDPDSWQTREALSLSLTLRDGELTDYDVVHLIGTTAMPPVYTSEGANVELTLDTFSVEGNIARVAGRVDGTLALQESLGQPPSLEEGIDIAVEFEIEAIRIEF
jgi:hypothetical protein